MKRTIGTITIWVLAASALWAEGTPPSAGNGAEVSRAIAGAIRWDAWYGRGFATAGWDPRPRVDHPTPWVHVTPHPDPTPPERQQPLIDAVTATPAQLAQHLHDAMDWTRNNRDLNPANAIIICGWNENDEGGWLIPTLKSDGQADTSRLDAISRVLTRKGEAADRLGR